MPAQPKSKKKAKDYFYGTGKRKTAVAKVRLFKGKGEITINEKPAKDILPTKVQQDCIYAPLKLTGLADKLDATVLVNGGGKNCQAEAIRHGISRALLEYDELLRGNLKKVGFLTRDSRIKERKKYGLKRARRAPQFSKR